jgi:hypothetical protein
MEGWRDKEWSIGVEKLECWSTPLLHSSRTPLPQSFIPPVFVTIQPFEKHSNPPYSPFFKGGKGSMIHRIPAKNLSSLWKREAGRDFWQGRFKRLNCYQYFNFCIRR